MGWAHVRGMLVGIVCITSGCVAVLVGGKCEENEKTCDQAGR